MRTFLKEHLRWVEERDYLQGIIDMSPDDRLMDAIVDDVVKEAAKRGFSEIVRAGQALKNPSLEEVRLFLTECLAGFRPDTLTVKEYAERNGVSTKTVYQMVSDGRLIATRVGRVIRISPDTQPNTPTKAVSRHW
jgi:excisionase family DNA binding protein